ncbi:MAG: phosphatase PAP2 family protein [Candidatus Falkowbacteria bacterium]|nr:phosphatase PAP2 family protein [Candidatus Falkowbacteria bacterium]
MNEFLKCLTDIIGQLGNWGYALLALISFLEAIPLVGFFIPGVIILILGGFLVAEHVFNFFDLVVICASFTLLGDMVAFALGHRFSGSFKKEHKIMKEEYLTGARNFITKRGSSGIFFGRFISPVRSALYFVLGLIKMPWLKFMLPVATSSFIFVSFYVLIGYLAGNAWQTIEAWSGRLAVAVAATIIVLFALWWFKGFLVHQGRQLRTLAANALSTFFNWYQQTNFWNKFSKKFPAFSQRFIKLSNPSSFFSLPFSSLILLNIVLVSLTFCLGSLVLKTSGFVVELDYRLEAFVKLFAEPHLATVLFFITMLGSPYFVLSIALVFSIWLILERRRSYFIGLWITIAGTFLSGSLIKFIIARPRPAPTFFFENSYAFPSLHSAMAIALLLYLTYYAVRVYPRLSRNISLVLIAVFFTLAIGFSRIYLGVHYLSDVLGGYMVGGFWFVVAIVSQRFYQTIDKPRRLSRLFEISVIAGVTVLLLGIYLSQIIKPNDVTGGFYNSLSIAANKQKALSNNNIFHDSLVTENLRGTNRQPITFIFNSNESVLAGILTKSNWIKRLDPSLSNVLGRLSNLIIKKDYSAAPLQPRYWNNQPNYLTFTKLVPSNKAIDFYILRLWQVKDSQNNNQESFIAELAVNQDFSWKKISKQEIFSIATKDLLNDIMTSPNFSNSETKFVKVKLSDEIKDEIDATIYTVNFK